MICDRFDVVVVPFPFVDAARVKPRPALGLSNTAFNRANRHTVLAMITRATHTRWPSDHAIEDLRPTGLRDPSVVRSKVFTFDNRILQRRIWHLSDEDARGCSTDLETIFRRQGPCSGNPVAQAFGLVKQLLPLVAAGTTAAADPGAGRAP
jgi:mRNA interferase MazF